jgi:hypothetical protein
MGIDRHRMFFWHPSRPAQKSRQKSGRKAKEGDITMKMNSVTGILAVAVTGFILLFSSEPASAHCDTLDGPVVVDARKALADKDVTPVLKWVRLEDEKKITAAFQKALSAQGKKQQAAEEKKLFESLVRIHRAGEGAPFSGLKPAGTVEPVIARADEALLAGTPDEVVRMVTEAVGTGIRQRYVKVAEALKHKDESVAQGREFVEAYVDYTHYVEKLHQDATGRLTHGEHATRHNKGAHAGH